MTQTLGGNLNSALRVRLLSICLLEFGMSWVIRLFPNGKVFCDLLGQPVHNFSTTGKDSPTPSPLCPPLTQSSSAQKGQSVSLQVDCCLSTILGPRTPPPSAINSPSLPSVVFMDSFEHTKENNIRQIRRYWHACKPQGGGGLSQRLRAPALGSLQASAFWHFDWKP